MTVVSLLVLSAVVLVLGVVAATGMILIIMHLRGRARPTPVSHVAAPPRAARDAER